MSMSDPIADMLTRIRNALGFKTLEDGRKIRVFKSNGEAVDA